MTAIDRGRTLVLEGAFNCRDLGGLPTRDGRQTRRRRLYRADSLDRLTEGDLHVLRKHQISTIVDLRADDETAEGADALVRGGTFQRLHLPVIREIVNTCGSSSR